MGKDNPLKIWKPINFKTHKKIFAINHQAFHAHKKSAFTMLKVIRHWNVCLKNIFTFLVHISLLYFQVTPKTGFINAWYYNIFLARFLIYGLHGFLEWYFDATLFSEWFIVRTWMLECGISWSSITVWLMAKISFYGKS